MTDSQAFMSLEKIRATEARALSGSEPGELMYRAASEVASFAETLLLNKSAQTTVTALIGPGNNGGDALLALMLLQARGYRTRACALTSKPIANSDAQAVWSYFLSRGGSFAQMKNLPDLLPALSGGRARAKNETVLIDGMFGIGLHSPLEADAARAAQLTHRLDSPVIAIDVPSGVNAETGAKLGGERGAAVKASHTITFIANKAGLHTGEGRALAGKVSISTLGIEAPAPSGLSIDRHWVSTRLRKRLTNSHKGTFGTVGILGGSESMPGAALLAARAAQAGGAGKIAIMSPGARVFDPACPQLMCWLLERPADLDKQLEQITCLVAGCGLGTDQLAGTLLARALAAPLSAVIDADALNMIAADAPTARLQNLFRALGRSTPTIITPHPLEAARLLKQSVAEIENDRVTNAKRLASEFQSTVILKGAGSVIAEPGGRWAIISSGNAALATGGTGDMLAGLAGALLAQGYPAWEAAAMAAWLHGDAADSWTQQHPRQIGMGAGALLDHLIESINHC